MPELEQKLPEPAYSWLSRTVPLLWRREPERLWRRGLRWIVDSAHVAIAPSAGYGAWRVPAYGGVVIGANHLSGIDPTLVGVFSPRVVWNMAKVELLATPVVGEVLQWTGAFPVRRGEGDREAIRMARELVRDRHCVCLFLEGTRQPFGYPGPIRPGALSLALQEDVPLVPAGVYSFGWTVRNRARCAVVYGEPMTFEGLPRNSRGYRRAAELVQPEIVRLWRLAGEAVARRFPEELSDGTRWCPPYPPFRNPRSGEIPRKWPVPPNGRPT